MNRAKWLRRAGAIGSMACGILFGPSAGAQPVTRVIYSFPALPHHGLWLQTPVISYGTGLAGVTQGGGATHAAVCGAGTSGCGTVYRLLPPPPTSGRWTLETLHTFDPTVDGAVLPVTPVADAQGNIYGVATSRANSAEEQIWKLSPPVPPSSVWTYGTIGSFTGATVLSLALDAADNVFGSVVIAGTRQGAIFCFTPAGGTYSNSTVYNFSKRSDGYFPTAFAIVRGNRIVGATNGEYGASLSKPAIPDTAFTLSNAGTSWRYRRIYDQGTAKGHLPLSPPLADDNLNIVVTNAAGGQFGAGEIFRLSPPAPGAAAWSRQSLFDAPQGSGLVSSNVVEKRTGRLLGVSYGKTTPAADGSSGYGLSTYRLDAPASGTGPWVMTLLHDFGLDDSPGGLVLGRAGLFYGVTLYGGTHGAGMIFAQSPG